MNKINPLKEENHIPHHAHEKTRSEKKRRSDQQVHRLDPAAWLVMECAGAMDEAP